MLVSPPFFRFFGSHNDKAPMSLCYLSGYFEELNYEHLVINYDYTGSDTFWSFKVLFDRFESFYNKIDSDHPLFFEILENILSYNPDEVILMAGDPLYPTKDIGNLYITSILSEMLKKFGIKTIGIGPYFYHDKKEISKFDCVIHGSPSLKMAEIIRKGERGEHFSSNPSTHCRPNFKHLVPELSVQDNIFSSFGCLFPCTFCLAGTYYRSEKLPVTFVDDEVFVDDVLSRNTNHLYITDLNFPNRPLSKVISLADALSRRNVQKTFVAESRIDMINDDLLIHYKRLGISTLKIGIETFSKAHSENLKKKNNIEAIEKKFELIKSYKLKIICYILLGGHASLEDYSYTIEMIKKLKPDNLVVSIWSYSLDRGIKPYDTQFSSLTLRDWKIPDEVFHQFIALQADINTTVGNIISES